MTAPDPSAPQGAAPPLPGVRPSKVPSRCDWRGWIETPDRTIVTDGQTIFWRDTLTERAIASLARLRHPWRDSLTQKATTQVAHFVAACRLHATPVGVIEIHGFKCVVFETGGKQLMTVQAKKLALVHGLLGGTFTWRASQNRQMIAAIRDGRTLAVIAGTVHANEQAPEVRRLLEEATA